MIDRRAHLSDRGLYRRFYDALGARSRFVVMEAHEPRLIWALARIGPTDSVIDIGCDKGQMTVPIRGATRGRVAGVDISASSIAFNRTNAQCAGIEWTCAEAERLPFADATFSVALLCEILEHVVDPAVCIAEAERVVKPGGRIIISVPVDAEALERRHGLEDNRRAGFELDGHVRDYQPSTALAGRDNLEYCPAKVPYPSFDFRWWLASYSVRGSGVLAAT